MILYKYNPNNASYKELKSTFIGREKIITDLINDLKSQSDSKSNQHYLFIGPRGIGKTNLLKLLYYEINKDKITSKKWIPVQFAEEEYSITSLRDFLKRILEISEILNDDKEGVKLLNSFISEPNDEIINNKAIEYIKKYSKKAGKKFVILIDNLNLLLGEQIKDDIEIKTLRNILMNDNFIVLIGASPTYFDEVSNYEKPLYNLFKLVNLEELEFEQVKELLRKRAEYDNNQVVINKIDNDNGKLNALYHLTGGNPRLILILYQLFSISSLNEVNEYLQALLDDLTPYYQNKIQMLSVQQRKILDIMAKLGKSLSPSEIAKELRLHVNNINSNLKRMMAEGYIKLAQQERRKITLYIISERLFRIWHQMRFPAERKKKIKFLVEFMQIWYSSDELINESFKMMRKLDTELFLKNFLNLEKTIENLENISQVINDSEFSGDTNAFIIDSLIFSNKFEEAESRLNEKKQIDESKKDYKQVALDYSLFGKIYFEKKDYDLAIKNFENAIELDSNNFWIWLNLGQIYLESGKYDKALECYNESIKINNHNPRVYEIRGFIFIVLKSYEKAIMDFDNALELDKTTPSIWNFRGYALLNIERYQDAIESFNKAIELNKNTSEYFNNRGIAFAQIKQYEDAVNDINEAIKIDPTDSISLYVKALILHETNQYEKAIQNYLKALENIQDNSLKGKILLLLFRAYLNLSLKSYREDNSGFANINFIKAVEYYKSISKEDVFRKTRDFLVDYFHKILSLGKSNIFSELIEILAKNNMNYEIEILNPLIIANSYFEKNKDQEILDRLNPELREIVEEIINKKDEPEAVK